MQILYIMWLYAFSFLYIVGVDAFSFDTFQIFICKIVSIFRFGSFFAASPWQFISIYSSFILTSVYVRGRESSAWDSKSAGRRFESDT